MKMVVQGASRGLSMSYTATVKRQHDADHRGCLPSFGEEEKMEVSE